jgi:hypothetical protein
MSSAAKSYNVVAQGENGFVWPHFVCFSLALIGGFSRRHKGPSDHTASGARQDLTERRQGASGRPLLTIPTPHSPSRLYRFRLRFGDNEVYYKYRAYRGSDFAGISPEIQIKILTDVKSGTSVSQCGMKRIVPRALVALASLAAFLALVEAGLWLAGKDCSSSQAGFFRLGTDIDFWSVFERDGHRLWRFRPNTSTESVEFPGLVYRYNSLGMRGP